MRRDGPSLGGPCKRQTKALSEKTGTRSPPSHRRERRRRSRWLSRGGRPRDQEEVGGWRGAEKARENGWSGGEEALLNLSEHTQARWRWREEQEEAVERGDGRGRCFPRRAGIWKQLADRAPFLRLLLAGGAVLVLRPHQTADASRSAY